MDPHAVENEPTVTAALERVIAASQRVMQDRTDLVFIEVRELLEATFEGLLALGLAVGFLMLAWVALSSMLVFLLSEAMPRAAALAIVAGVNVVGGAVLLRLAMFKVKDATTFARTRRANETHAA